MVELAVSILHEGLRTGGYGFGEGEPADAAIFVGFTMERIGIVGLEKEATIEMEVGRDKLAALIMMTDGNDLERKDIIRKGTQMDETGLLAGFFFGDVEEVGIAVGVAASPSPSLVDVVKGHEDFVVLGISNPAGGGEMTEGIFAS